jgi:hypothetical protein
MRSILVCALSTALLTACGGSAPAADAAVVAAIRSAPSPTRMHALNDAAHRRRGESAALVPLLGDADPGARWAAAYVAALWADDDADVRALAPHLDDRDEAVRAVIAGSLAGLGHSGARQALAGLTASAAAMPYSDPPLTVGRFAADALAAIGGAGR